MRSQPQDRRKKCSFGKNDQQSGRSSASLKYYTTYFGYYVLHIYKNAIKIFRVNFSNLFRTQRISYLLSSGNIYEPFSFVCLCVLIFLFSWECQDMTLADFFTSFRMKYLTQKGLKGLSFYYIFWPLKLVERV